MKVESATFVKSVMRTEECPRDGRPEIAFVGRSNVGKSSLLNTLLNRKGLAKTSRTPGKTQTINFFDVNGRLYFVDLPGYGYAKVPKGVKEQWSRVMAAYLRGRDPLRLVVQLLDARHTPSEGDHEMLELLRRARVPVLLVATKIDKLNRNERVRNLKAIRTELNLADDALVVPFSAATGEGVKPLWDIIVPHLDPGR
jgi:GTP-binding protein